MMHCEKKTVGVAEARRYNCVFSFFSLRLVLHFSFQANRKKTGDMQCNIITQQGKEREESE